MTVNKCIVSKQKYNHKLSIKVNCKKVPLLENTEYFAIENVTSTKPEVKLKQKDEVCLLEKIRKYNSNFF